MVTLVGQEILRGRHISVGRVTPHDWLDFIDINYLRKQTALFSEFRETGMSNKLGYNSVADLRANYPDFFWKKVRP
jgi:hypothetical protein